MAVFDPDSPVVRAAASQVTKEFGSHGIVGIAIFNTEPEDGWFLLYLLMPASHAAPVRKSGRGRKRKRPSQPAPVQYVWRPLRYERYEYEGPDSKLILAGFVGDQDSVNGSATEAPDLDEEHRAELERNICGVSLLHLRDVCSFFAPGFGNITLAAGLGLESDHAVYAKRLQVAYLAKDGVAEQDQLAIKNLGVQEPPPPPRCHKDDLEISFKLLGRALAKRGDMWDIWWCYQDNPSARLIWVADLKPNEVLRFSYLYWATSSRGSYRRMVVDYPLFGNFINGALTPDQADKALEQLADDLQDAAANGSDLSETEIVLEDDDESESDHTSEEESVP